jgi:predicted transposase YbfD/YdcC
VDHAVDHHKGHGRIERREVWSREAAGDYLGWPGAHQVCRITRQRTRDDKSTTETVYAITSLPTSRADARELLRLCRNHWSIENKLHGVRDGTFREDACRVRAPSSVQLLAALRNTAITLTRHLGFFNAVEAVEYFAEFRPQSVQLVRHGRIE